MESKHQLGGETKFLVNITVCFSDHVERGAEIGSPPPLLQSRILLLRHSYYHGMAHASVVFQICDLQLLPLRMELLSLTIKRVLLGQCNQL